MHPLQPSETAAEPDIPTLGFTLMAAIAKQDVSTVRALLASLPPKSRHHLANFGDYDRRTPLHIACVNGLPAIVKELLRAGADPLARDRFAVSCVQDAIRHGRVEVLRVLGQFCTSFPGPVQPTQVDPRYTFGRDLMAVVAEGNVNAAKQLVRHFGANVNFANADGRTPLHIAVVKADMPITTYLLEAGADKNRPDRWGVSPADEAAKGASRDIAELMARIDGLDDMLPPELANIVKEAAAFVAC